MNRFRPVLFVVLTLTITLLGVGVISAASTIAWAPASTGLPASGIVRDVAFGDVNNDAKPDLVVAFTGGSGLAVYGGNGVGVWSTAGFTNGLPATGSYEQLALGDIFPDGNADIFASRGPNAGLAVWRGDGAGSWTANSTGLTTTGTYNGVALADVNHDGLLDLIAAGETAGVRVYRNNITSYAPITNPIGSGAFNQVVAAYVNDDAYPDLAATGNGGIYFWKGAINSSWTLTRTTLDSTHEFRGLALGDLDNDSRPELVASRGGFSPSGGGIFIYEWDPTWSFSNGRWLLAANQISTTKSYARIALRDINNDGWLDVVAVGTPTESGPGVAAWLTGPFGFTSVASPAVSVTLGSLSLADFDRDGLTDIAAGDSNNGGAMAWRGSGVQATLDSWLELPSPQTKGSPFAVGHGNLDRDGWLDVVLPGFSGGLEGWTGDGGNSWPPDSYCSGLNKAVTSGAYGDIVMDVYPQIGQDASIVAARTDGGGLLFVTGVNCAGGAGAIAITGSGSYGALSAGDLLRNGTLDVVAAPANAGAGLQLWYRGGVAWNSNSIAAGHTISDTALGDMDHDGELEIVVAETSNGGVAVYDYNHGWVRNVVTATRTYYAVAVGDLDNDGNVDIVGGKNGSDTGLDVWFGDSSLTNWKRQNGPDNGSQYYTVDLADFNHDGHLDLLAATEDRGVRLWAGDGAGGWATANSGLPTTGLFFSARFGHVDHDGNLDILATGYDSGLRLWTAADGAAPTVEPFRPSLWISATQSPTLTAHVLDAGSGISVTSGQYRYSTNAGAAWSGWFTASISGANGSTAQQIMTTAAVPFNQDSNAVTHDLNKIEFRAADMAGNVGSAQSAIWIDTVPPPAPDYFASESHTVGGWSTNRYITVTFAGVNDATSGWVGSSVLINQTPSSLPAPSDNATSGHYTTGPLADGLWYAHMRARDDAGNWGTVAGHIGPLGIDTTPPANPTVLYSSDHDPWVWSNDTTITMNWSGAADSGGSGVRGYSYIMDTSPSTLPDAITETLGTTATIGKGTGNNHYFHIRTRDNVGNWSATAIHAGPYYIDTIAPTSAASSPASAGSTSFTVSWSGADANSGIASYDIQSRDKTLGGAWTDWKLAQTGLSATFTGTGGHIYEFRSRAHDHAGNVETYPSYADTTTEVATIDLFIRTPGIEVNQSSQDLSNTVPLIRSKRTFVRCYVQSDLGTFTGVKARLKFYSNGVYQALLYPMNPGGTITVTTSPQRSQLNDAFLFDVPASYMKLGNATFECEINYPARKYAENDYGNNLASVTLNVNPAGVLNLNIVDVRYYYGGVLRTIRNEDRWRLQAWLEAAYPIQWVNPTWSYLDPPYDAIPEASTVNSDLDGNISDVDEALAMHHYGMAFQVDGNTFMRGSGQIWGLVASGPTGAGRWWENDDSFGDWYGGHELSHNYGLRHILCAGDEPNPVDYPYPGGQISPGTSPWALGTIYGIDGSVSPPDLYPPNTGDIRSYCEPIWVGPLTYQFIWPLTSWASQASAVGTAADPVDRLAVYAKVLSATDVVTLSAFYHVTSATDRPGRDISGAYSIRFFDAGGALLSNYPCSPTLGEAGDPVGLISERPPWISTTQQVAIWHGETALITRTVSANPPTIHVDSPNGDEALSGATAQVSWTGNDLDGDALTYRLDYSRDGGVTWQGISPSLHHPTATLDLSILPGATQGKFRVTASDGVNTASDATDGVFTVPDKLPEITHLEPVSGTTYIHGQTVTFRGGAFDPDDNVLSGDRLTWTSSLMGTLGAGALLQRVDLVVGAHLITLTATDSQSNTVSATTVVIIEQGDEEFVSYLPIIFKQAGAP